MKRILSPVLCMFLLLPLFACGGTKRDTPLPPAAPVRTDIKLRVADVSNKTGELFDVDVIGNMWNALDAALHQRGLLWEGKPGVRLLEVRAEIVEYQKGSIYLRNVFPPWGRTSVRARCDVWDGDRVIASSETVQTISMGDGSFTLEAYRKIFSQAAEDLVSQIVRQL